MSLIRLIHLSNQVACQDRVHIWCKLIYFFLHTKNIPRSCKFQCFPRREYTRLQSAHPRVWLYNQSKKSNHRSKNLHNQDFDKQTWIRSIRQRSTTPHNAYTDTTCQITQSNRQSRPKQRVASEVIALCVEIGTGDIG